MRSGVSIIVPCLVACVTACGPSGAEPKPPAAFPNAKSSVGTARDGGTSAASPSGSNGQARDAQVAAAPVASPAGDAGSVKPPAAPEGLSTAGSDPAWMQCGSMEFPKPAAWTWTKPTAPFRTLQYAVPGDAELIVSVFPAGDGGAVDANVDRWAKQFGGPASVKARSEFAVGEFRVTRVDFEGDFKGMGMGQAKTGMSQLGAIVQGPRQSVFVRVLGAKAAVQAARGDFDRLVQGVRGQAAR
jgi:hypothetical protein